VALAAAKALEALGEMPAACLVEVSGNAIKNIESVTVPGTDVLKEIRTAVATGVIGGQPGLGWEVLSQITADEIEEINDFLQNCSIQILPTEGGKSFHIKVVLTSGRHIASFEIADLYT
jgi:L-cysteine desulfidase